MGRGEGGGERGGKGFWEAGRWEPWRQVDRSRTEDRKKAGSLRAQTARLYRQSPLLAPLTRGCASVLRWTCLTPFYLRGAAEPVPLSADGVTSGCFRFEGRSLDGGCVYSTLAPAAVVALDLWYSDLVFSFSFFNCCKIIWSVCFVLR